MGFILSNGNSLFITTTADLVDDTHSKAWAEKYISNNPNLKWMIANYVEADNPNRNQHFWSLADLKESQPGIAHAPINVLHNARKIIGHITNSEMVYPLEAAAGDSIQNPYVEVLGALYKHYFPGEMQVLERAYKDGALTVSMECTGSTVLCDGPAGCGKEFDFEGDRSPNYCAHLNNNISIKHINDPNFTAMGVLVPPVNPGWQKASVTQMAELTKEYAREAELAYAGLEETLPHLGQKEWESMMFSFLKMVDKKSTRAS